ncbi:ABC transporter ATP-binding protein [Pontiella sp.]|uniref:ABC transporter ATP-binding protein n=1 Tax=Pontiella sp. TaxID=2837462 RepID=UPI00356B5B84
MRKKRIEETGRAFGRAFALAWLSSPRLSLAQTLLSAVQALLPLAGLYALKKAVDAASSLSLEAMTRTGNGFSDILALINRNPESRSVVLWFVVGAVVMGMMAFLRTLVAWVAEQHAIAVSDHVHSLLHAKMVEVDLAFYENSAEQNRLHLVQEQAMTRPVAVLGGLFRLMQGIVGLIGVLVLLAALQPLLVPVLVVAGAPGLLLRMHRSRRMYEWRRALTPMEREAGYFHRLLTTIDSAKELRLHGHGAFCRARFEAVRKRLREARLAWRKKVLGEELVVQLFALLVAAGILFWLTGQLFAGIITLGSLVMYAQAVQRCQGQVGIVVAALVEIHQSSLFLTAFDELLSETAGVHAPEHPRPVPSRIQTGVVFEKVGFVYPGTERPVLRNLSFTLRANERLAIAGANGAGKSTVVKLLARLYDPTSGRILVDGVDLREFDPHEWRKRVGVLFQDFGRYQLSAAENIWIGDPVGPIDDPRIAAAAGRAGLDKTVEQWPDGLSTPLGRWLHEGVEPSMGQWQRLAIARAVVRDADLLVMDEPTSALDSRTQRDIFRLLQEAAAGRMTLLVSHRPELLAIADRIVVLCDGAVAEEGTADALRAGNGEFSRIFAGGKN